MSRKNGGIIGPANTPVGGFVAGVAGGVWRMNDVANFVGNSQWPKVPENIDNSLRFEAANSDYLVRTPSSASNKKTFTFSTWVKRVTSGSDYILSVKTGTSASENFQFGFRNDQIQITSQSADGNTNNINIRSDQVFRDFSAWYHLVCAVDTTQGTSTDRLKLYVNGSQVTSLENTTYPSQNDDIYGINGAVEHAFGRENYEGGTNYHSYYLAETVLVDGSQLDPTSFGEFDTTTGIWKPKKIGQFASAGNNSFYLNFKDSSNVGKDASGLSNNFTVNNLTSIDQATDTCVENFATLNPLSAPSGGFPALSEGNLQMDDARSGGNDCTAHSTIAIPHTGKWYYEIKVLDSDYSFLGLSSDNTAGTKRLTYYGNNGNKYTDSTNSSYGASYGDGDIVSVAVDIANNSVTFYKNGSSQGAISYTFDSSLNYFAHVGNASGTNDSFAINFGNPPYSISSGNSDANGFGNFEYSVPSGYYALNTSNLNTYG